MWPALIIEYQVICSKLYFSMFRCCSNINGASATSIGKSRIVDVSVTKVGHDSLLNSIRYKFSCAYLPLQNS